MPFPYNIILGRETAMPFPYNIILGRETALPWTQYHSNPAGIDINH